MCRWFRRLQGNRVQVIHVVVGYRWVEVVIFGHNWVDMQSGAGILNGNMNGYEWLLMAINGESHRVQNALLPF